MRVRDPLAIILMALFALATACSSSTVIDAESLNEAPAGETVPSTSGSSTSSNTGPEPAATSEPPEAEPDSEPDDERDESATDRTLSPEEREVQWNALAELCRSDDARACDVLFLISDIDSEYEELGSNCNGTGPPESGWCTEGITTGLDGLAFDDASPGLSAIAAACSDGDMMACDFLYFASPGAGQWEDFGDGCGGLTVSAFPDCRSEFPDG